MAGAGEQPEGVTMVVSKPFTLSVLRNAIGKVITDAKAKAAGG